MGGFHMTFGDFKLRGFDAEVIEVVIIVGGITLIWKAVTNLLRLHLVNPPR